MIKYYAVRHKSLDVVKSSRSGGFFTALSDYVLQHNGIIYGCAFNAELEVVHIRATTFAERDQCRGSKYVQSVLGDTFELLKKDLEENKLVLFSGTSCQVNSLLHFLGSSYDNLLTLDILCHAVSSPKVFEKLKLYVKNKYKSSIDFVDFRNKLKYGWGADMMTIKTKHKSFDTQSFYSFFGQHISIRPSCFNCKYHKLDRGKVDFTVGDFGGIEKLYSDFKDDRGTSMVICNTVKGQEVFSKIRNFLIVKNVSVENIIQPVLIGNFEYNPKRESFFIDLDRLSYSELERKYISSNRFYNHSKQMAKSIIYKLINKWKE